MIASIMGWVGLSKLAPWLQELIFVASVAALVAGGYGLWHHKVFDAGEAAKVAEFKKQADIDTAKLQAKANTAEKAYADEHQANMDYQSQHPDDAPVRLCVSPAPVRKASAPVTGAAGASATSANVPTVSGGNHSSGSEREPPDIRGLLVLLARRADDVSAVLREEKARQ